MEGARQMEDHLKGLKAGREKINDNYKVRRGRKALDRKVGSLSTGEHAGVGLLPTQSNLVPAWGLQGFRGCSQNKHSYKAPARHGSWT